MPGICQNLKIISSELAPAGVKLVAVSKLQPEKSILEAYHCGQKTFGENRVQELLPKAGALPKDIEWHLIGHLQTNKVKFIAPFISLIHSVDSLNLLKEIDKEVKKNSRIIPCLLQIRIAREETKFGMKFDKAKELFDSCELQNYQNIKISGLMGMATQTEDQTLVRSEFRSLHKFYSELKHKHNLSILSMGMSGDYKIAVEEGSNMVRIGSSIFNIS